MKSKSLLLGPLVVLASFTTALSQENAREVVAVFYLDATLNCVQGEVDEVCAYFGVPDCVKPINGQSFSKQIYATSVAVPNQPGRFSCTNPYRQSAFSD